MSNDPRFHLPLLSEALANLRARAWFTCTLIFSFASLICLVTVTEHNAQADALRLDRRLALAGHHTLLVEGDAGSDVTAGLLTAERCSTLRQIGGVRAVVWFGAQEPLTVWSKSAQVVPVRRVDGDVDRFFADLAGPLDFPVAEATLLIDESSLAARPHQAPFDIVVIDDNDAQVTLSAATIPLTALGAGLSGSSLWREHIGGTVAGCAVDVTSQAREMVARSVHLAVPMSSGAAISWASPMADEVSSLTRDDDPLSRHIWFAATCVGFLIAAMYRRIRRRDLALYALWGLDQRQLLRLALGEFALILTAAIALAGLGTVGAAIDEHIPLADLHTGAAASARMCLALGGIISALAWRWARKAYREAIVTLNDF